MKQAKGFSLIELLIVIAIILIIAAIAIPNLLQARIAANEASAVSAIRVIGTAQTAYYQVNPNLGYAALLSNLGAAGANPCTPSPAAACLVDDSLALAAPGGAAKSGFFFGATGIPTSGINTIFVAGATPKNAGTTGNHNYCASADGAIRIGPIGGIVTTLAGCNAYPVAQ